MSTHATAGHAHMSADDAARMDAMSNLLAQNWWAVALRGVVGVLFGLVALLLPATTMLSLILLFAAYMLVDGVFAIVSAVRCRSASHMLFSRSSFSCAVTR